MIVDQPAAVEHGLHRVGQILGRGAKAERYPAAVPTRGIWHPGGVKPVFASGDKIEIAHRRVNGCVTMTITHNIPLGRFLMICRIEIIVSFLKDPTGYLLQAAWSSVEGFPLEISVH